jgi:hypothetical protein
VLLPTEASSHSLLRLRGKGIRYHHSLQNQSDSFVGEYCQNRFSAYGASTWEGMGATRSGRAVSQRTLEPSVYTITREQLSVVRLQPHVPSVWAENRPSGSCDKQPRDNISNLQHGHALGIVDRHLLTGQKPRVVFATQKLGWRAQYSRRSPRSRVSRPTAKR